MISNRNDKWSNQPNWKDGQLIRLDLSRYISGIIDLPASIGNLINLTKLDLRNNQLTSLPESIGNLVRLQNLYFEGNQLTYLPESIGNLINLQVLDLGSSLVGNQLTSLPESIGNLTKLKKLFLFDNQLSSLPESIGNLVNLTDLGLTKNQLTFLPESIGNLKNLSELGLSKNRLTSLPESIGNLKNLSELGLSKNQLTFLPESIGNLVNLQVLDLRGNRFDRITSLPESLWSLKNLYEVKLDEHNILCSITLQSLKRDITTFSFITEYKVVIIDEIRYQELILSSSKLLESSNEMNTIFLVVPLEMLKDHEILLSNRLLVQIITNNKKIYLESSLSNSDINDFLNDALNAKNSNIRKTARSLHQSLFQNQHHLFKDKENIPSQYFLIYLLVGIVMTLPFYLNQVNLTFSKILMLSPIFVVLTIFFFIFQIYQGATLERYLEKFIDMVLATSFIFRNFKSDSYQFFAKFHRKLQMSSGVIVALIWIITLSSFGASENEVVDTYTDLPTINFIIDLTQRVKISSIEYILSISIFETVSDTISKLISGFTTFIFSSVFAVYLRIVGILTVFWAVFDGGWKVLLLRSKEDRSKSAELNWYEVFALPLGIVFAILAILINDSTISLIPIIIFKLGIIFGGFLFLIFKASERFRFLFTLLIIIFIELIFQIPVHPTSGFTGVIITYLGFRILIYWTVDGHKSDNFFWWSGALVPRLLGMPRSQGDRPSLMWKWLAGRVKLDPESSKFDMQEDWDLSTILFINFFKFVSHLLIIRVLAAIHVAALVVLGMISIGVIVIYMGWKESKEAESMRQPRSII